MSQARNETVTLATRQQITTLDELGWYHSIELPDGSVIQGLISIEQLRSRIAQFPIPEDLRGKRVLDIGAWDGWFSFEMERRGAHVVALDAMDNPKLRLARELRKSNIEIRMGDICRISPQEYGLFDIVLFFGVLYHVKHPVLALENVCAMSKDLACIESYVTDDGSDVNAVPVLEFYESTELRGQFDNWCGPNTACLLAMSRAAGFASVKLESVIALRAHVTCRRIWPTEAMDRPAPWLILVENSNTHDQHFPTPQRSLTGDTYLSLWFKSAEPDLTRDKVFVEMGFYAARPANINQTGGDGWCAGIMLPPGITAGWHPVRLRVTNSAWSNSIEVPVDIEPAASKPETDVSREPLVIELITDGKTWERWQVKTGLHSCISLWVRGIGDDCSVDDVRVRIGDRDLPAVFISTLDLEGRKQVNALLPIEVTPGKVEVTVKCRDRVSNSADVELL